jgi:hypothetical protein
VREVPELCKSCKYSIMLGYGIRCRKKTQISYRSGEVICVRYRKAKRFVDPVQPKEKSSTLRPM